MKWLGAAAILLAGGLGPAERALAAPSRGGSPGVSQATPTPTAAAASAESRRRSSEEAWRSRFRALRVKIDNKDRLLTLKRAELYDKIEKGETAKKPRRWAIEGFVINTEKQPGEEPRYLDPLEREVHEMEQDLARLRRELRDLEFEASVAGIPKSWRE
jgi:hypothetical protein